MLISGTSIAFANLGDSRAVYCSLEASALPSEDDTASPDFFVETTTRQISVDHKASDASEAAAVRTQSGDQNAIRPSKSEGVDGQPRVAGSLAVTRTFGDFYLKYPEFCQDEDIKPHLPYLLEHPFVSSCSIDTTSSINGCSSESRPNSRRCSFIVMASDGLWDHLSNEQVTTCVSRHLAQSGLRDSSIDAETPVDALMYMLFQTVAAKHDTTTSALLKLQEGRRRHLFDDTTISIIILDGILQWS